MKYAIVPLLLIGLLWATPTLAHKVNLFAYAEGGKLYVESYFPDGRPIKQGVVEIFARDQQLLRQGVTDDEGLYACVIPDFVDLKLVIRASMGHQGSFAIKQAELESGR
jgi:nickel transport protein